PPEPWRRCNQSTTSAGLAAAGDSPPERRALIRAGAGQPAAAPAREPLAPEKNFRFFDNRQKYLLFVNTCSEKDVVARRVGLELGHIHPQPPAVRLFDAGMGDGTVLARVMREMHRRFPTVPFYIVGKEISLEDVRLSLRKMVDRFDYRSLLDEVIPKRGHARADYDMVIASQPYRARARLEFKAQKVIAPLVRALGEGGRLLGIHSYGHDPGLEIIQRVWPGENPFTQSRHDVLRATKSELGKDARRYNFNTYSDARSLFRYDMHTLPSEISESIGTSTLFAAWNAAIYVAQIDDLRLGEALRDSRYLDSTREVLQKHGSLWFLDESYVVSRKRD